MKSAKFNLILEIDKLKNIYRHNITEPNRSESSAEHSWSVLMIFFILEKDLMLEFPQINLLQIYKMGLIHDLVEIYAGDVNFYDTQARAKAEALESLEIGKFAQIDVQSGAEIQKLWSEFEAQKSIEAQIIAACDKICPMFMRAKTHQSFHDLGLKQADLDLKKRPHFEFSQTFMALYHELIREFHQQDLFFKE